MPRHPLLIRTLAVAAVALAILVPLKLISGKVEERRSRAAAVLAQYAHETSGEQALAGPLLALTCEQSWNEERQVMRGGKAETVSERRTGECPTQFFAPRTLRVDAHLPVETLRRGIYPIPTFRAEVALRGEVEWPSPPESSETHTRRWKEAFLVMRVGDRRGIKAVASKQDGDFLAARGIPAIEAFSVREAYGPPRERGTVSAFSYDLTLAGVKSFQVLPVGEDTEIHMRSNWPHPSFAAQFSPEGRSVGPDGFEAKWRVTSVSTGGTAAWARLAAAGQLATQPIQGAGVLLYDPVDVYALSFRASEYGLLFVLFTFAALAVAEVLGGVRLHPVQYGLVGCALAVFFLLLLALAEHIAFGVSYAIASAACVLLLTYYLRHPLGTYRRTAFLSTFFAALYGSLFVLLRQEDHALLLGSLLVFSALATTMGLTRRVDWAAVGADRALRPAATGAGV